MAAPKDPAPHLSSSESELVLSSSLDEESCSWEVGTWERGGEGASNFSLPSCILYVHGSHPSAVN